MVGGLDSLGHAQLSDLEKAYFAWCRVMLSAAGITERHAAGATAALAFCISKHEEEFCMLLYVEQRNTFAHGYSWKDTGVGCARHIAVPVEGPPHPGVTQQVLHCCRVFFFSL